MNKSQFQIDLERNIRNKIIELKKDGCVGMTVNNLLQVTKPPTTSNGAPSGSNVAWHYHQLFLDGCYNVRIGGDYRFVTDLDCYFDKM